MISKISSENLYINSYARLVERFHFSFGDYLDAENGQFGVLNALNEFMLEPGAGFSTHAHKEMEIISYCLDGELTHVDNMGNRDVIRRGDIQYLSAGTGILHSEMNESNNESLHFYQIWINPSKQGLTPYYVRRSLEEQAQRNKFMKIASGEQDDGLVQVRQDANIYVANLSNGKHTMFANLARRQCFLLCLEGSVKINGDLLRKRDALKVFGATKLEIFAGEDSHLLMIEMASNEN
jgi:redox-sensitive bicupin YhaK (pirin superfamily)